MRIYLVRHGETTGDLEDRFGGDYEDHLTPHGVEESKALARKLAAKGIKAIYSSPRIRAQETASLMGEATGAGITVIDGLGERNHYGILTGMVKAEAEKRHPKHVAEMRKGLHHNVKGSENYSHFKERVIGAFGEATKGSGSPIVIVTHGGVIKCIVRELLKLGEMDDVSDCCILTLDKNGEAVSLISLEGASLKQG